MSNHFNDWQQLDLIDLLNKRQHMLQDILNQAWDKQNDLYISDSEWYIIAIVYQEQPTISYISRNIDISRQAIHKLLKNLEVKKLITIKNVTHNKKEKYVNLTPLGEECYQKNKTLKIQLEEQIAGEIGIDQVDTLKQLLQQDWRITSESKKSIHDC